MFKTLQRSLPSFSLPSSSNGSSTASNSPLPPAFPSRRTQLFRIIQAAKEHLRTAGKLRVDPNRSIGGKDDKNIAVGWMGQEVRGYAEAVQEDDDVDGEYSRMLSTLSEAQIKLSAMAALHYEEQTRALLPVLESQLERYDLALKANTECVKAAAVLAKAQKKGETEEGDIELNRASKIWESASEETVLMVRSVRSGEKREKEAVEQFVRAELEMSRRQLELYQSVDLLSSGHSSPSLAKSSLLSPPNVSTRMSRSKSDAPLPPSRPHATPVPRTRSSSLRSSAIPPTTEKSSFSSSGNRSRSGSMLSRITNLGGGRSRQNSRSNTPAPTGTSSEDEGPDEDDESDNDLHLDRTRSTDLEDRDSDGDSYTSPTAVQQKHANSQSREDSSSGSSFPTLRSLNLSPLALKKSFSSSSPSAPGTGKNYSTLQDGEASTTRNGSGTRDRSGSRNGGTVIKSEDVFAPSSSLSSPSTPAAYPVGRTFVAQWDFLPSSTPSEGAHGEEELPLPKGARVVVDRTVNAEWWIGSAVEGGRRGMFPCAFVKEVEAEEAGRRKVAPRPPPSRSRTGTLVSEAVELGKEENPFA